MKIEEVEGIGPVSAARLATAGITTTEGLHEMGAKPGGRAALASTGLSGTRRLDWVNHVDPMQINGVGSEH